MKTGPVLIALALCAAPTFAEAREDMAATVRSREAAVRVEPQNSGAQIELAAAYQRAGRAVEARATLHRALALDNVMLETPNGDPVWSHEEARRALQGEVALTSR